jgi:hypothetical protein
MAVPKLADELPFYLLDHQTLTLPQTTKSTGLMS